MTDILVTGGSGFVGSNLVKALVLAGNNVRVLDNNYRGCLANLQSVADSVEIVEGDIREAKVVDDACKNMEVVYHLAFINGTELFYKHPDLVMDVGVRGHLNAMDACSNRGVARFVYASSSEIYQVPAEVPTPEDVAGVVPDVTNPRYSYGGSKLMGELLTLHYAKDSPMHRVIFRPHNFYGPAMGFEHVVPQIVRKICEATDRLKTKSAKITIQGTGSETRAFCYIDDAIEGIILAATKGSDRDIYNVGTDNETTIRDLILTIADVMAVDLHIGPGPLQAGSTPRRCPDISRLVALGYKPRVDLRQGLQETVKWYTDYYLAQGE